MDIFFSHYQLTPRRRANSLSDLSTKSGIFLKTSHEQNEIADYFPHEILGDQSIQEFLESFPDQKNQYHQSILLQLQKKKSPLPQTSFLNHQLWQEGVKLEAPVVKYKIMEIDEEIPSAILNSNCKIRLDANGIFKNKELSKFLSRLDPDQLNRIEYIEDPNSDGLWTEIPIPCAKDFIKSNSYQILIYKPNREHHLRIPKKTIFSGYMGHPLGTLHAYKELIERGDLHLYHGLLTPNLYQEDIDLFEGNYSLGFKPNTKKINEETSRILDQRWELLCSI